MTQSTMEKFLFASDPVDQAAQYNSSKLANLLHGRSLAKRLSGSGVSVFTYHPGVSATDGLRKNCGCGACLATGCFRTPSQGASPGVFCAIADIQGKGQLYNDSSGVAEQLTKQAEDDEFAEALWLKGEELSKQFDST